MINIITAILISMCIFYRIVNAQTNQKNSAIILIDIESDPNDTESMVCFFYLLM
jgi:hypothetical protein